MTELPALPFTAAPGAYLDQAQLLLANLHAGDEATAWRFKWEHPRFRDAQLGEVRSAALVLEDAKLVTARSYAFESWADLAACAERASLDRGRNGDARATQARRRTLSAVTPVSTMSRPCRDADGMRHYTSVDGAHGGLRP